jgi:hypothetical protein
VDILSSSETALQTCQFLTSHIEQYGDLFDPLTPKLNPSAQRCLTRFFTEDFAS